MQLLTVKQAAEAIQVSEETIRIWLRDGRIKGKKIGRAWRISREELQQLTTT